ncbi:unnamed protein product [Cuscuta epithymum]|uniref:DUF3615 domain-containing protein n=1 Tax=Cuscuta epithymum TaxID=186058 RepID=A0AAV0FDR0_9ASTE|nr:unnamed protein product [Cuscuta epithymum]
MVKVGRADGEAANYQSLRRCENRDYEDDTLPRKRRKSAGKEEKEGKTRRKDKGRKSEKAAAKSRSEEEERSRSDEHKMNTRTHSKEYEATRRRFRKLGKYAVKLYNRENGTCFQMVDLLSHSVSIGWYPDFHRHLNITAKLPQWDSPRRFFVEVNDCPKPTHCFMVEVDPENAVGFCLECHRTYKVMHPPSRGYRVGSNFPEGFKGPRVPLTIQAFRRFLRCRPVKPT